jgi:hypothetical protein
VIGGRSLRTQHARLVDGQPTFHYTHEDHDPGDENDGSMSRHEVVIARIFLEREIAEQTAQRRRGDNA